MEMDKRSIEEIYFIRKLSIVGMKNLTREYRCFGNGFHVDAYKRSDVRKKVHSAPQKHKKKNNNRKCEITARKSENKTRSERKERKKSKGTRKRYE